MNVAVVVPTVRPERMDAWYAAWKEELHSVGADLYVIEDATHKSNIRIPGFHYAQTEINADLSHDHPISFRTDGIRCYGFLQALRHGADIIITLDDDVLPHGGCLQQHVTNLTQPVAAPAWEYTTTFRTRGLPYRNLNRQQTAVISHGLWTGVADLDAPTQLAHPSLQVDTHWSRPAPFMERGKYFPMSAMNLAFHRCIAPAMLFPPQGAGQPYDRFGDIWCGIIAKRVCDHLGWAVHSGAPYVEHQRASDVFVNLTKEAPGLVVNEEFWRIIDDTDIHGNDAYSAVYDIAQSLKKAEGYYSHVAHRLHQWLRLLP